MQKKIQPPWPLLTASVLGIALPAVFIFSLALDLPVRGSDTNLAPTNGPEQPPVEHSVPGLPIRLTIPTIKVDAAVESVGRTPGGAMDVPKDPAKVAWFDLGQRPGENGSAVMAGHYGWIDGIPTVFDDLSKLRTGDRVFVQDEHGATTTFVVRESRNYDPNTDASDVFGSSDGIAHLNLVTCGGVWNEVTKSYPKRLVVFTDRE